MINQTPLFVDLDGTLIKEDLSNLAFWKMFKNNPIKIFLKLFLFLFFGKAYLKEKISKEFIVPINNLNFNTECIKFIEETKNQHRVVYLISGSHQCLVEQINNHLNLFNEVFGTCDNYNMVGINKVKFINKKLKYNEFDYVGNSKKDMPIWEYTKKIIYTNADKYLIKKINDSKLSKIRIKEKFIKKTKLC